ncbi:phenylalanine--tRNA ligase subunit alpha [Desulfovibrio inopinatus]|uniref:phenylalanine--tRNA ligase subunit alpha n=1 Tax=Desulfovibrio inopinatus TaxID=102109 RepID=UPI000426E634|nr:phenylalanine--tRNA ligase subunit alpha [Desulfovibrio inopinatus]
MSDLFHDLHNLVEECRERLDQVSSFEDLEDVRVAYLGRKGALAAVLARLPELSPEMRPEAGKAANTAKNTLTTLHAKRIEELKRSQSNAFLSSFDPAMPGRAPHSGSLHPITLVMNDICTAFAGLGFDIVIGPEIETDYYNFEALNFPPEHPARDMQDTLYIGTDTLLRTHTSPLQVRTMLSKTPPVAAIAPGKVYRRDSDLTHTPMFHQIEGFLVDKNVSMADLRGVLTAFVHRVFGTDTMVRFRPSFFPFTEPSAEVDISCTMCAGKGVTAGSTCRVCKGTGWLEILGCGMIDPNVFTSAEYDPEVWTGFAFGMGLERIAMLKYGIGDLRMLFENDTRFLRQFA